VIAMDIAGIVESLGHEVSVLPDGRPEAVELAASTCRTGVGRRFTAGRRQWYLEVRRSCGDGCARDIHHHTNGS